MPSCEGSWYHISGSCSYVGINVFWPCHSYALMHYRTVRCPQHVFRSDALQTSQTRFPSNNFMSLIHCLSWKANSFSPTQVLCVKRNSKIHYRLCKIRATSTWFEPCVYTRPPSSTTPQRFAMDSDTRGPVKQQCIFLWLAHWSHRRTQIISYEPGYRSQCIDYAMGLKIRSSIPGRVKRYFSSLKRLDWLCGLPSFLSSGSEAAGALIWPLSF